MADFDVLGIAADGMKVQRMLLDVAARNVAAAQAATPEHPFPRLVARFANADATLDGEGEPDLTARSRYLGTEQSGQVADALTEMIAVLDAQRGYEAHASIFDVGKRLAERTLDLGRN